MAIHQKYESGHCVTYIRLESHAFRGTARRTEYISSKKIESKEVIAGEANKIEQKSNISVNCRNCGSNYPDTGACPAKGKSCNNCGKPNHFAAVCRGKPNQTRVPRNQTYKPSKKHKPRNLKTLDTESNSSDDDYLYSMTNQKNNKVNVTMGGAKFKITIDTGATINVIDRDTFNKMQDVTLNRTNTKAFAYSTKSPVEFLGKFETVIETRKRMTVATLYVAKGKNCCNLLSLSTAQDLGLVGLHIDCTN